MDAIEEIGIGPDARLYVKPCRGNYEFIYRAAMSVRWNKERRWLYVLPVSGFSLVDDYRQILSAAWGECGARLAITAETRFVNVPLDLERALRETAP
jgi:hypothetical protein